VRTVEGIADSLEDAGHEITFKWWDPEQGEIRVARLASEDVEVIDAKPGRESVIEKNHGDWTVGVRHKPTGEEATGHGISRLAATESAMNWLRGKLNAGWAADPLKAREIAEKEIQAVDDADALVLVWAPDILGAAIETGSALGTEKLIYVYRPGRDSVFWYMGNVHIVWSKTELMDLVEHHESFDLLP
jgi:hypothetical protein